MEKQIENKEKAPCFDIDKFTEDTREALLVLNLHYFSKVMEENEKLKQTRYLCLWTHNNYTFYKFVIADTKEEAITKLLLMDELHFISMLISDYNCCTFMQNIDIKKQKIFNKFASYGLLKQGLRFSQSTNVELEDSFPDFRKKYNEFITNNLNDMIYIALNIKYITFSIIKIDDKLFVK